MTAPRQMSVTVPATSANLGPGFDCLGLALARYDRITARVAAAGVRVRVSGEGAGELPTDDNNLVVQTMLSTFDRLGRRPDGLALLCENAIPQARGLGSSAAAIVAGVLLAHHLVPGGPADYDDASVIRLAARLEGHPDNVAACVLGGLTLAWIGSGGAAGEAGETGGAHAVRLGEPSGVATLIFVPAQGVPTEAARAALPMRVPLGDAAHNAARAALLTIALTRRSDLLFEATADRLHQRYRVAAMPQTAALVSRLRERGIAAVVSGAGPSVLALVPEQPARIAEAMAQCPPGWWAGRIAVAAEGATVQRS